MNSDIDNKLSLLADIASRDIDFDNKLDANIDFTILLNSENHIDCQADNQSDSKLDVVNVVSQLFNDHAVLFKEKINFKLPGGAGFAAHQDTPAYINMGTSHITAMIAIDPCTIANGCLYVSPGDYLNYNPSIALDKSGILTKECEEKLRFEPVECLPGDFQGVIVD
eukprot:gene20292-26340_t